MATVRDTIMDLYDKLAKLEARVAQLEQQPNEWDEELPTEFWKSEIIEPELTGLKTMVSLSDDSDLEDLDPDKRAAVLAARARLANEDGGVVEDLLEEGQRPTVEVGVGNVTVTLPDVGEERRQERREFSENVLRLHEIYPAVTNIHDAYAKGGPMWLYLMDRDLVVDLPPHMRQQLVLDVQQDSPKDAYEMAADIMKVTQAPGPPSLSEAAGG